MDDLFPAEMTPFNYYALAFSHNNDNDLWVTILEKAYAKAYGSYHRIIGGDPVYALRDLTGAPYERIEDFKRDPQKKWKLLLDHVRSGYLICAYTPNGAVTEEESEEGIVSGHAYALLDAREVIDSQGRQDQIIQMRNPWGRFEWVGEWGDESPLWTPQLRNECKVTVKDDGVFWMPWRKFMQFYSGIGVCKVHPSYKYNAVTVDQTHQDHHCSMIRVGVPQSGTYIISVDQMDSKFFRHHGYSLSYLRISIARAKKNKLQFIDARLSCERNVFFELNLTESGDYIVYVEVYWADKDSKLRQFVVSCYGEHMTDVNLFPYDLNVHDKSEYYIWKDFVSTVRRQNTGRPKLSIGEQRIIKSSGERIEFIKLSFTDYDYGVFVIILDNTGKKYKQVRKAIEQIHSLKRVTGFTVLRQPSEVHNQIICTINPQDLEVIIFKMNPEAKDYEADYKVTKETLVQPTDIHYKELVGMVRNVEVMQPNAWNKMAQLHRADSFEKSSIGQSN